MDSNITSTADEDRSKLQQELLFAVKECQSRYGGRTELATELDTYVKRVCYCFESVLNHGLRQEDVFTKSAHLIKHAAHKLRDNKVSVKVSFWNCIYYILSPHERDRYIHLRNIKTNYGRGRAWLRSALNEKSLDRYFNLLLSDPELLNQYYEPNAFLRDPEKSYILPTTTAGLVPILFAISIDKSEFDVEKIGQYSPISEQIIMANTTRIDILKVNDACKKIQSNIITFGESDINTNSYEETTEQKISDNDSIRNENNLTIEIAIDASEAIDDDSMITTQDTEENTSTGLRPIGDQGIGVLIPLSCEVTPSGESSPVFSNSISEDAISVESMDELSYQKLYELTREQLKRQNSDNTKLELRIEELNRENEVLKHQLRKYVSAVQMLKQEDADHTYEAQQYEKKLVQVAEMHGELMELNSRLQIMLHNKEDAISRLQEELVSLRGPLPANNVPLHTLLTLWIPSVFMAGRYTDPHHVYQVHLRINSEEWNVYRRYAQFHEFHRQMKKEFAFVSTFHFPPKKTIGNKETSFVEDRRIKLQLYLRQVINFLITQDSLLSNNPTKALFTSRVFFFSERYKDGSNKYSRSHSLFPNCVTTGDNSDDSNSQYSGL